MQLKEEGNQHFQLQDYKAATKSYSQALKLTKDKAVLATLYRNRAACGLKTVCGRAGAGRQGCGGSPFLIGVIHPPLSQPSHLDPSGWRRHLPLLSWTHCQTHSPGRHTFPQMGASVTGAGIMAEAFHALFCGILITAL